MGHSMSIDPKNSKR